MSDLYPRLIKGGLVLLDAKSGAIGRTIALQYNPDSLSRSFQVQGVGGDGGAERAQPYRLKGPAIETIRFEAEIDATDGLAAPGQSPDVVEHGIAPQLAALEALINPTADQLVKLGADLHSGVLEILPPEVPLLLFIWSRSRVLPVRLTDFSITEEAFDPALNPIRARVSISLRVLSTDDLGYEHRGSDIFINHLRGVEALARKNGSGSLSRLGLSGLP